MDSTHDGNIAVKYQDRLDSLIKYYAEKYDFDWLLIKAVVFIESSFNHKAESHVGAQGLMQLMPETAKEMGVKNPFDIEENLKGGCGYLRIQYEKFGEIPFQRERIKYALASYVGGRAYIKRAISLAKKNNDIFSEWSVLTKYLSDSSWPKNYPKPDFEQILNFVDGVIKKYNTYKFHSQQ